MPASWDMRKNPVFFRSKSSCSTFTGCFKELPRSRGNSGRGARKAARRRAEEPETFIEEGIVARAGKIYIQTDRYPATPERLVHLFAVCARRGLGMANVTRQWISHNKNVLDAASGDPCVKDEFLDLLRADSPEVPVLRRFYDYGLMTALIPELASVHGLVQHDQFHLYPVQEHHLRTVAELKKTIAGVYSEEEPELTVTATDLGDPAPLLLAGLLHDVGKSSGSGHAARGGEMIPAVARRLGLSSQEADTVQFLVSQHLLLLDSASLRDLADQEMLSELYGRSRKKGVSRSARCCSPLPT